MSVKKIYINIEKNQLPIFQNAYVVTFRLLILKRTVPRRYYYIRFSNYRLKLFSTKAKWIFCWKLDASRLSQIIIDTGLNSLLVVS